MFFRYLAAIAFIIFCVTGMAVWVAPSPYGEPWWLPFAAAVGFPTIIGIAILIVSPDE